MDHPEDDNTGITEDGQALTRPSAAAPSLARNIAKFLPLFLSFAVAAYFLVRIPSGPFVELLVHGTGALVAACAGLLGTAASYSATDGLVTVAGFTMLISIECTAIQIMVLYAAAVVSWPRHDPGYKAAGLAVGLPLLFVINALRIVALGYTGAYAHSWFEITHSVLWQGALVLVAIAFWWMWESRRAFRVEWLRFAGLFITAAAGSVVLISVSLPFYGVALAAIAGMLVRTVSFRAGGPDMTILSREPGEITFIGREWINTFPISVDVYDMVMFLSLMVATRAGRPVGESVMRIGQGLALLFGMHVLFVVLVALFLIDRMPAALLENVLWGMRTASILANIGLWWVFSRHGAKAGGGESGADVRS